MKAVFVLFLLTFTSYASVVYSNDFSTAVGSELSVSPNTLGIVNTPGLCTTFGSAYCGSYLGRGNGNPLSNHTVSLSLPGLSTHDTVEVHFLLFVMNTWDGNTPIVGPDHFQVRLDGNLGLDTTFSNVILLNQAFPNGGSNPPQTGAVETNRLGTLLGNAVYDITLNFAHTASTLNLTFQGSNLQGWPDEGWGLDNLSVSTLSSDSPVPEPATVLLVSASLGGAALLRRARGRRNSN